MITLETARLTLISLAQEQLRLLVTSRERLERELAFPISPDILTPPARRAVEAKLLRMPQAPVEEHPWHTYWLLKLKSPPYGIGLIGFKGCPNPRGEAEVGYGIALAWQNQGFMTEAAQALVAWAFAQPGCRAVVAETRADNPASIRVLEKIGMQRTGTRQGEIYWRLDR